jgi:hypothetical protein
MDDDGRVEHPHWQCIQHHVPLRRCLAWQRCCCGLADTCWTVAQSQVPSSNMQLHVQLIAGPQLNCPVICLQVHRASEEHCDDQADNLAGC